MAERYCIGIRKEDESKRLERRAPLVPDDVRALLTEYPELEILVERSEGRGYRYERAFPDAAYAEAGATLVDELGECPVVLGIKEIQVHKLDPNRTYAFFSHTFKGQSYNLPLIKRLLALGCTLVDYEMIVDDVEEAVYRAAAAGEIAPAAFQQRTVFFGKFAGLSGVIDSLWALGQRLVAEGDTDNPFAHLKKSLDYQRDGEPFGTFEIAMEALARAATRLREEGLPEGVTPLVIGITGRGNAARGAREVLDHLPLCEITPELLLDFDPDADEARHTLYVTSFGREHTAEGRFEGYLGRLTVLMNCVAWDRSAPRIVTRGMVRRLYEAERPRLRVIGDISCDPGGSIEFCRRTYPDYPIYTYEPHRDLDDSLSWEFPEERLKLWEQSCTIGHEGRGPIVMAVTNLPCEFPRDASVAFSQMLRPYVMEIARLGQSKTWAEAERTVARTVRRATMIYRGALQPDYRYLSRTLERRVLVLGAGKVSPALLAHLKERGYHFTVADRDLALAEQRVAEVGAGRAMQVDLTPNTSPEALLAEFSQVDLVVDILPPAFHTMVARGCVHARVPLVYASYITPEIRALDEAAREAGVTLLGEMGLDPGIDHMSAVRLIAEIRAAGGEVESFGSFCGGLPAPDVASNPLRYKFSWSPAGVVRATLNPATFRRDGERVTVPPSALFEAAEPVRLNGGAPFECYPNRDSLPYIELYGVPEAQGFMRGTLRYEGWGRFWNALRALGWLEEVVPAALPTSASEIAARLGLTEEDELVQRLTWLLDQGLPRPGEVPVDAVVRLLLAKEELHYAPAERDMVLLIHRAQVRFPDGRREQWLATLTHYGEPARVSAMSLTTGGTLAIGAEALLEGIIDVPGVQIPVNPDLADFALAKLAAKGVRFDEQRVPL